MRVRSNALTPIRLDLFEEHKNEAGGKAFRRTGESMVVQPGESDVDDGFMKKWLAANEKSTLLEKVKEAVAEHAENHEKHNRHGKHHKEHQHGGSERE